MLDPHRLLDPTERAPEHLARRGFELDTALLGDLVARRRTATETVQSLRSEAKSRKGGAPGADDEARARAKEAAREIKERIAAAEEEQRTAQEALEAFLLAVPNLPDPGSPDGHTEAEAREVRREGSVADGDALHHADLGEAMGLLDPTRAAKLAGPRFAVTRGALAVLQRGLTSLLLDMHTREQGYAEHTVPTLVTREVMTGTGQLPKFEADLFRTEVGGRELFLVPTGEVPLVNLYAGETLDVRELPLALTAHTPCFRGEAGSYGRDTRGMFRVHEFGKVELVRICRAEDAAAQLERVVEHAQEALRRLELAHRVMLLAAGDLGFSARRTYDLEVWLPADGRYREISSCSDCGTFQGRRARIRSRTPDGTKADVATINGSALPIGRTLIALLEQHQEPGGAVRLPEALVPYVGFDRIEADGSTHPIFAGERRSVPQEGSSA